MTKTINRFAKFTPFLTQMVRKDFIGKYKRSNLGIVWSVLRPLLTMLIMMLIFSKLIGRNIQFYASYMMVGMTLFGLFSEATNGAMVSIRSSAGMIMQTGAPKYIFPLSKCLLALLNFIFSFAVLLFIMYINGVPFSPYMLLFPIPVVYTIVFSYGIGLMLSVGYMFFQDMQHLWGVITTLLNYMSAIFYKIDIVPDFMKPVFGANPMYLFITMFRNVLVYDTMPTLGDHLTAIAFCASSLAVGIAVFRSKQNELLLHM
jgi:ABC-2 type transport system permease protein